ncbi:hypothetical protein C9J44_15980 [Photobacterium sp. GB-27]|nr:hypothetical protein C9J44_15980 [Photobacterium sp. GB-27]
MLINKYAGISCFGTFLVAAFLTYLPVAGWLEISMKTLVLLFLLHMVVYSFCVALSAKRTYNKVLLIFLQSCFQLCQVSYSISLKVIEKVMWHMISPTHNK